VTLTKHRLTPAYALALSSAPWRARLEPLPFRQPPFPYFPPVRLSPRAGVLPFQDNDHRGPVV